MYLPQLFLSDVFNSQSPFLSTNQQATKVLQKSEQMARNEHTLNYNENAAFTIDCKDFVPIYTGEDCVKSSYSGSAYKGSEMKGKVCLTDGFSTVGVETIGLVTGK